MEKGIFFWFVFCFLKKGPLFIWKPYFKSSNYADLPDNTQPKLLFKGKYHSFVQKSSFSKKSLW